MKENNDRLRSEDNYYATNENNNYNKNEPQQRLMGAWAYFGYRLLFAIPLVGFILLIVFSFDNTYICRRNFARSFFCGLLIVLILIIVIVVLMVVVFAESLV